MKRILSRCTASVFPGLCAYGQGQPEETALDSVWEQAVAGNSLDLRLFGCYAPNKYIVKQ